MSCLYDFAQVRMNLSDEDGEGREKTTAGLFYFLSSCLSRACLGK
jgi:hypothetical protein